MNSFSRFNEEKLLAIKCFFSSTTTTTTTTKYDYGKISDDHVSFRDYLTCEKIWDEFQMKNLSDLRFEFITIII